MFLPKCVIPNRPGVRDHESGQGVAQPFEESVMRLIRFEMAETPPARYHIRDADGASRKRADHVRPEEKTVYHIGTFPSDQAHESEQLNDHSMRVAVEAQTAKSDFVDLNAETS